jgi:FlaA1/EpsC-like NDP-sugar epimerase
VVGFLDDNPAVRRRRVLGVKVLGGLGEAETHIRATRPLEVLVTIPGISPERLEALVEACASTGATCRVVRREIESPPSLLKTSAE